MTLTAVIEVTAKQRNWQQKYTNTTNRSEQDNNSADNR